MLSGFAKADAVGDDIRWSPAQVVLSWAIPTAAHLVGGLNLAQVGAAGRGGQLGAPTGNVGPGLLSDVEEGVEPLSEFSGPRTSVGAHAWVRPRCSRQHLCPC